MPHGIGSRRRRPPQAPRDVTRHRAIPDRLQVARGAEHLCRLGPRALSEFLLELANTSARRRRLRDQLHRWRALTPEILAVTGGDRFAPETQIVPRITAPRDAGLTS